MRDKLGVWKYEEGGHEPDDREHHLHVDLGPGVGDLAGVVTAGPGDDHPPPLQTDGEQGEHDHVTGKVLEHHHDHIINIVGHAHLEHGEEVAHDAPQEPVVDQEHEQGHGEREGELEQRRQHRAQHAALDGAVAVQTLPANQRVMRTESLSQS